MQHHTAPQQPHHAGLEYINHGGLEVVGPTYYSHSLEFSSVHSPPPVHPPGHDPANAYWDQGVSRRNSYQAYLPSNSSVDPSLVPGGAGGSVGGGSKLEATGPSAPKLVCGIRSSLFAVIVAIAGFIVVLAASLGVGLGLGLRHTSSAADSLPLSSATSTGTMVPSRTTSYPAPKATVVTTAGSVIACPSNNETLYQSRAQGNRKFLLLCGRDYSSSNGAVELFNTPTDSFAECLDKCAANTGCKAVGWGNYKGSLTCWLKSEIGAPHPSTEWYFAVGEEILRSAALRKKSQIPS